MTTQRVIESAAVAVIGGVDTHKNTHCAAVVDDHGRAVGHREFAANDRGYADLLAWIQKHGEVVAIGVEHRILWCDPDAIPHRTNDSRG